MPQEQKSWSHTRKIIVHFPSTTKVEPNLMVAFEIQQTGAEEFCKIFFEYLEFCSNNKALIKIRDEITDVESGELCLLAIEIAGERKIVNTEMQRIGRSLMQYSTLVR